MKRKFSVSFEVEVEVEIDEQVIQRVDDEWRESFYSLYTPEEIAAHITYNLVRDVPLSALDGWADLEDSQAVVLDVGWHELDTIILVDDEYLENIKKNIK